MAVQRGVCSEGHLCKRQVVGTVTWPVRLLGNGGLGPHMQNTLEARTPVSSSSRPTFALDGPHQNWGVGISFECPQDLHRPRVQLHMAVRSSVAATCARVDAAGVVGAIEVGHKLRLKCSRVDARRRGAGELFL